MKQETKKYYLEKYLEDVKEDVVEINRNIKDFGDIFVEDLLWHFNSWISPSEISICEKYLYFAFSEDFTKMNNFKNSGLYFLKEGIYRDVGFNLELPDYVLGHGGRIFTMNLIDFKKPLNSQGVFKLKRKRLNYHRENSFSFTNNLWHVSDLSNYYKKIFTENNLFNAEFLDIPNSQMVLILKNEDLDELRKGFGL